jgi:hypothetical protein
MSWWPDGSGFVYISLGDKPGCIAAAERRPLISQVTAVVSATPGRH